MKHVDYIIVGLGLAGAALAIELHRQKRSFVVFDQPEANRASAVAAGLFNPITGKIMKVTWNASRIFPFLHQWYRKAEHLLHEKFFHPRLIYRPFNSVGEQNEWMGRSTEAISSYLEHIHTSPYYPEQVNNPYGGLLIRQGGSLDVKKFLRSVAVFLEASQSYRPGRFDLAQLQLDTTVKYAEISAEKIIFCEGIVAAKNPYFNWLPIRPLGGEILEVELSGKADHIYNRQVYVVPVSDTRCKVGATYIHKSITGVSNEGKQELTNRLENLLRMNYKIVHQDWGIRPVVVDRKPIMGTHPKDKKLVIFNGLGTKGVSLAPYHAHQLARWLAGHGEIDPEANIDRFKSLYSKI